MVVWANFSHHRLVATIVAASAIVEGHKQFPAGPPNARSLVSLPGLPLVVRIVDPEIYKEMFVPVVLYRR